MPKRVLITGDSGLIGNTLAKRFVSTGIYEVYGVSRSSKNLVDGVIRYTADLTNKEQASQVIGEIAPNIVYHMAANAAEGKSMYSPIDITENGINSFYNTVVPAINSGQLEKFVFPSSIAVYGQIHPPFKETDIPQPVDIYGINKLACERGLRMLSEVHGFEHAIVRPHNVYGPGQNMKDPYRNVVVLFMNHILKGEAYSIYGDGSMRRCFSYVEDVVDILMEISMVRGGGTYNVGADDSYTIKELSDLILEISGSDIEPKHLDARVHEVYEAVADHTLQNNVFGYSHTPLKAGLIATWKWAKEQGAQDYVFTEPEIVSDKLPKNWKQ